MLINKIVESRYSNEKILKLYELVKNQRDTIIGKLFCGGKKLSKCYNIHICEVIMRTKLMLSSKNVHKTGLVEIEFRVRRSVLPEPD